MIQFIAVVTWLSLIAIATWCLVPRKQKQVLDNYCLPVDNVNRLARYRYKKIVLRKHPNAKFDLEIFE